MGMPGLHAPIPNLAPGSMGPIAQFISRIAGFTNAKTAKKRTFSVSIVDPHGMGDQEWADAFVYSMAHAIALPKHTGSFDEWALQVSQEPQLQRFQLPLSAASWDQWAQMTNAALASVGAL
jgi:hypothetical protein